jgi:YD repeat-containing protein
VNCLLDTHFILWIIVDSPRLADFPWLDRYRPWGISPVSLLEIAYLGEAGRLEVDAERLATALAADPRFLIDDVPLLALVQQAMTLSWTRDPFDRLIAAHSAARRTPLCSADRLIGKHHEYLPREAKPG